MSGGSATKPSDISFSRLAKAARCGEAFRRSYVIGSPAEKVNVPALVGTAFHEAVWAFEAATEGKRRYGGKSVPHKPRGYRGDEGVSTKDDIAALKKLTMYYIRKEMDDHGLIESELIYWGKQDLGWHIAERVPKMAFDYINRRKVEWSDGWKYLGNDPEGNGERLCTIEKSGYRMTAAIDAVLVDPSDRIVIRDLKTGKVKEEHALQMEFYRVALKLTTGHDADYGQLLYVGREGGKLEVVKFRLSDEEVIDMAERLYSSIEQGIFMVTGPFNGHCGVCDHNAECPFSSVGLRGVS